VTTPTALITPEQCRVGRKLLGWSQLDLAQRAGASTVVLVRFESRSWPVSEDARKAIQRALESAGVVLVGGSAHLRQSPPSAKADA
jgi:ribosome-binding protein aMBF1 (putative translation factor)